VRGGEKATQIQHWIWEEARVRLGRNGQPELDDQGKPIKELVRLERPRVMSIRKLFANLGGQPRIKCE